jgi:hypothetical protein
VEKEDVVVAVMASTGLSYDDAAERVARAIESAQREKVAREKDQQVSLPLAEKVKAP